jgi:acyl carrier protein
MAWTSETVRHEIIQLLQDHIQGGTEVSVTSHLVADLGIDSLGTMEVVADIEDKFKLTIPDDTLREINTVGDVAQAIETRLKQDGRLEG